MENNNNNATTTSSGPQHQNLDDVIRCAADIDSLKNDLQSLEISSQQLQSTWEHCQSEWKNLKQRIQHHQQQQEQEISLLLRKYFISFGLLCTSLKSPFSSSLRQSILKEVLCPVLFEKLINEKLTDLFSLQIECIRCSVSFLRCHEDTFMSSSILEYIIEYFRTVIATATTTIEDEQFVLRELMLSQSIEYVLCLPAVSKKSLAYHTNSLLPVTCELITIIEDESIQMELLEVIGQLLLLCLPGEYHLIVKDKPSDDSQEEEDSEDEDEPDINFQPLYIPSSSSAVLPSSLVSKTVSCIIDLQGVFQGEGNCDIVLSLFLAFLGRYTQQPHSTDYADCIKLILEDLFLQLKDSASFEEKVEVFDMFSKVLGCCTNPCNENNSLEEHFDTVYQTILQNFKLAKRWTKLGNRAQQKGKHKTYVKLRSRMIDCLSYLFQTCGAHVVANINQFFQETGPLFADPYLYCCFLASACRSSHLQDEAVKSQLVCTYLPKTYSQILQHLSGGTASIGLKKSIISGVTKLACSGSVIVPHLSETYHTLLLLLELDKLNFGVPLLAALTTIMKANKTQPQTASIHDRFLTLLTSSLRENKQKKELIKQHLLQKEAQKQQKEKERLERDMDAELRRALLTPLPDDSWEEEEGENNVQGEEEEEEEEEEERGSEMEDEESDEDEDLMKVDVVPKLVFSVVDTLICLFDNVYEEESCPSLKNIVAIVALLLESIQEKAFFENDFELYLLQMDLLISILNTLKKYKYKEFEEISDRVWSVVINLNHPSILQEVSQKQQQLKILLTS